MIICFFTALLMAIQHQKSACFFSEPFGPGRLFLGGFRHWELIAWVVRQDKHISRLVQVVLHGHH